MYGPDICGDLLRLVVDDDGGVAACVESGAILSEFGVVLADGLPELLLVGYCALWAVAARCCCPVPPLVRRMSAFRLHTPTPPRTLLRCNDGAKCIAPEGWR
jgi:hypothetical protein